MIVEALKGKRIFITGGTGFLGTAIIESLLRTVPDITVIALIRAGRTKSVEARLKRDVLANNCFDSLRDQMGSDNFDSYASEHVIAVAGDVTKEGLGLDKAGRDLLASADVVIHSAATVSFDAPLDQAVEINLLGPANVFTAYTASGGNGHFISVSTAYVAGSRKGDAPEASLSRQPHYLDIDWRKEVEITRRLAARVEDQSREPDRLENFAKKAAVELGAAGVALIAERTERLRKDWVKAELVALGRARAQSLGWPDAYTMTKALGEAALEELRGSHKVSIVRPSIIESSVSYPTPGWIRGFRMAEPIIISFARGLLKDFPGASEGVIDVIPVDLVVATILAVAAVGPQNDISYYHAASGSLNPLRYSKLVSLVRQYFTEHPLYDDRGSAIKIPSWTYPSRGEIESKLTRTKTTVTLVNRLIRNLPLRSSLLDFQDRMSDAEQSIERARSYVELYGAYAECEANYLSDNLQRLIEALDEADRQTFIIDPRDIDWDSFVLNTHLPSVVEHSRARTQPPRKTASSRDDRLRRNLLNGSKLVLFDLENTLVAANVVDSFAWLATKNATAARKLQIASSLLAEAPKLLSIDAHDRSDFLRYFYRRYRGADPDELASKVLPFTTSYVLRKAFPAGIARVRAHRSAGHFTVLVTGALSFVVEPLAPLFDRVISLEMPVEKNKLTGEVPGVLPIGEARADLLRRLAREHSYSITDTVAYADSTSDLPMLEAAGHAVAVNPDPKLRQLAKRRGWLIEEWSRAKGFSTLKLPIAEEL